MKSTSVLGFDIFFTRPKSCFGGVIKQSGYLVFQDRLLSKSQNFYHIQSKYFDDVHLSQDFTLEVLNDEVQTGFQLQELLILLPLQLLLVVHCPNDGLGTGEARVEEARRKPE